MKVVDRPSCPKCGGNICVNIGRDESSNTFTEKFCIGEKQRIDGENEVLDNGCDFHPKKEWDPDNPEETLTWNDDWEQLVDDPYIE